MKKIALFNHKEGVSKTIIAFNLGWVLTKSNNKRVLLVDADSQCNLTLQALGYNNHQYFYEKNGENNIKSALESVFKSRLVEGVECIQLKENPNLFLLPGHLDLAEYETVLGTPPQLSNTSEAVKNFAGVFNFLIKKTAEKYNIDIVIIDMSPSLSTLNKNILISSDYFIIPSSPDYFSMLAIKSLSRILPQWGEWAKETRNVLQDIDYPLPTKTPQFLGYTINNFNLGREKPTYSLEVIMNMISREIRNSLLPSLHQEEMRLSEAKYRKVVLLNQRMKVREDIDNYCLAEISDFKGLILESNKKSIPIFELSQADMSENKREKLNLFNTLFTVISEKILNLIDVE
jgi:cellulose biosynthesis protein BcsQ